MLRAVLARAPWVRSAPRAHGSRAGTPAGRRDRDPHRPPPAQAQGPSAGRLGASPAQRQLDRPRLSSAHARLPFLSACGSARLYLSLWWFNALLQTSTER